MQAVTARMSFAKMDMGIVGKPVTVYDRKRLETSTFGEQVNGYIIAGIDRPARLAELARPVPSVGHRSVRTRVLLRHPPYGNGVPRFIAFLPFVMFEQAF